MEDGYWEELDPEAQTFIMLCFEKDVTFLVNEEATTRGVWEKLKTNSNELDLFEIQNVYVKDGRRHRNPLLYQ